MSAASARPVLPPGTRGAEEPALRMVDVHRVHRSASGPVAALRGVSLDLPRGSFTAVMGPSGSGKSTFLQCAAGLDRPTRGQVWLGGTELSGLSEGRRTRMRRHRVGFVFQSYNLLPALTAQENITLPLRLSRSRLDREWARRVVDQVGIADRLSAFPRQLSGGQQQRVALARALITRPDLVLADEPTGALDSGTAARVLTLLRATVTELAQTVLMVTHDPVAASHAEQVLFLVDGRLVGGVARPTAAVVAERLARLGGC